MCNGSYNPCACETLRPHPVYTPLDLAKLMVMLLAPVMCKYSDSASLKLDHSTLITNNILNIQLHSTQTIVQYIHTTYTIQVVKSYCKDHQS